MRMKILTRKERPPAEVSLDLTVSGGTDMTEAEFVSMFGAGLPGVPGRAPVTELEAPARGAAEKGSGSR